MWFRLLAIVAGAVSMTILAWRGFGFEFDPFYASVLTRIEENYEYLFSFLTDAIRWAASHLSNILGIQIEVRPHWKHVFILQWLFYGKLAGSIGRAPGAKVGPAYSAIVWLCGGFAALVGAIGAGTADLTSFALVSWVISAFALAGALFQAVPFAIGVVQAPPEWEVVAATFVMSIVAGIAAATDFFTAEFFGSFAQWQSPGLAVLGAFLATISVAFVILGLLGYLILQLRPIDDLPSSAPWVLVDLGTDVLAALGGAATFVAYNQYIVGS